MQQVTRHSDLTARTVSPNVRALLQEFLRTRRLFSGTDEQAPFVTSKIKHTTETTGRPVFRGFDEFPREYHSERTQRIDQFLKSRYLDYHLESWRLIGQQLERAEDLDRDQGLMVNGSDRTKRYMVELGGLLYEGEINDTTSIIVLPTPSDISTRLRSYLRNIHNAGSELSEISIGVWTGDVPYLIDRLDENQLSNAPFATVNDWRDDSGDSKLNLLKRGGNCILRSTDGKIEFTSDRIRVSRKEIIQDCPNILLTTPASLGLFALKPHYDIVDHVNIISFPDSHRYTGLYGSHVANLISRIREAKDNNLLLLGTAAPVDDIDSFAERLFGLTRSEKLSHDTAFADLITIQPSPADLDSDSEDRTHYYFLQTGISGPGNASQYVYQAMLMGHTILHRDGEQRPLVTLFNSRRTNTRVTNMLNDIEYRGIWRQHINQKSYWYELAKEFGAKMIDRPLNIKQLSSEETTDTDKPDIVHTTPSQLSVLNKNDHNLIANYGAPDFNSFKNLAQFNTHTDDLDTHVFVFLSTVNSRFDWYRRAARLTESETTTILNPSNYCLRWLHNEELNFVEDWDKFDKRSFRQTGQQFLREYLTETHDWDMFYEFLDDPATVLRDLTHVDENIGSLIDGTAAQNDLLDSLERLYTYKKEGEIEIGIFNVQEISDWNVSEQQDEIWYLYNTLSTLPNWGTEGIGYAIRSLYGFRKLLRAAYYFNRYCELTERGSFDDHLISVTDNFFEDPKSMSISERPLSGKSRHVPVTKIFSRWSPFSMNLLTADDFLTDQSDHRPTRLVGFCPQITNPATAKEICCEDVIGKIEDGILEPEYLPLKTVEDLSGEQGLGLVYWDKNEHRIIERSKYQNRSHTEFVEPVQLRGTPQIQTETCIKEEIESKSDISLVNISAKVWVKSVLIETQNAKDLGTNYALVNTTSETRIAMSEPKIGCHLQTRGIRWDLNHVRELLEEEAGPFERVSEESKQFQDPDQHNSVKDAVFQTAADLLTWVIADRCGVSADSLLYSINSETDTIVVFEQLEGGKGIVDQFMSEYLSHPDSVLESLLRTTRHAEKLKEQIWAELEKKNRAKELLSIFNDSYIDGTKPYDELRNKVNQIVLDVSQLKHTETNDQLVSEVILDIETMISIASDEEISLSDIFDWRITVSKANVIGETQTIKNLRNKAFLDTIPEDAAQQLMERIEFDFDSCDNVLGHPLDILCGDDSVEASYTVLTHLEEYILTKRPISEEDAYFFETGHMSAGRIGEEAVFVEF